jgi:hypothetical protein
VEPTYKQKQLANIIDIWIKDIGSDERVLKRMHQQMKAFKELLDTTTHEQMDALCDLYPGFYRFAKLVEQMAQAIHDGTLKRGIDY